MNEVLVRFWVYHFDLKYLAFFYKGLIICYLLLLLFCRSMTESTTLYGRMVFTNPMGESMCLAQSQNFKHEPLNLRRSLLDH